MNKIGNVERLFAGDIKSCSRLKDKAGNTGRMYLHVSVGINPKDNSTEVYYIVELFDNSSADYARLKTVIFEEAKNFFNKMIDKYPCH